MALSRLRTLVLAFVIVAAGTAGVAAETVKIGVIAPFSGPFARYGTQFQQSVEAYVAQYGGNPGGHDIEWIWRDSGGPDPSKAKALAQELIVKDGVNYLAGFTFTPNALAVAPLIEEARIPTVIFNAATSIITRKSQYFVRPSFTLPQVSNPAARYAYAQGERRVITAVTDYAPGHDAEQAFIKAFTAAGGEIVDSIRMPIQTNDFAPFIQRIKDSGADSVFVFLPAGPPTFAFVKAYNENGLREAGIGFYGTGETDETILQALGDDGLGLITLYHWSEAHDSDVNRAYLAQLRALYPDAVANFASVQAYDGTRVLFHMIEAAGASDPDAAIQSVLGLAWESPRGPVHIDPDTRHITQNVYVRRVERDEATGLLVNREFETMADQPDWGLVGE